MYSYENFTYEFYVRTKSDCCVTALDRRGERRALGVSGVSFHARVFVVPMLNLPIVLLRSTHVCV